MRQRAPLTLGCLAVVAVALPAHATAEQSSQPSSPLAGHITAGAAHTCAVRAGTARCWGFGGNGRLGYGTIATIGDDEVPGSVGPVDVGPGGTIAAISAGDGHTCALLGDATLRCWGFGGNGRLGYGNSDDVGDDESPGAAGPVDVGAGRTVKAVSAGGAHTCAVLDDGAVRCWGYAGPGQLGYGNNLDVGDAGPPGASGPVDLGDGRTATAVTAGENHTCVLLDDGAVRCWGYGGFGQVGHARTDDIGDDEQPTTVGPVDVGAGRTAAAISAGNVHTCAVLDDGSVRCWGFGGHGQLGYGNTSNVGDDETPGSAGPVDLGAGRTAIAISAGRQHTCALLDDGSVRCWGGGGFGQLGYGRRENIGDDETPAAAGPVDLGAGRTAVAISAGAFHTCALLDDTSVRCWGYGSNGRLGLCSEATIGDDESPGAFGPVDMGAGGAGCAVPLPPPAAPPAVVPPPPPPPVAAVPPQPAAPLAQPVDPRAIQSARARRLRACLRAATRRPAARRKQARRACLKRHGRIPGRVRNVRARPTSRTRIVLTFTAPGSNAKGEPAPRAYVVRQSTRPLRRARDISRAPALCGGSCRFRPSGVGARIRLTITGLRPRTTYYYVVAARDNVSNRLGPRSAIVKVRT